jgi:hypothetical protein
MLTMYKQVNDNNEKTIQDRLKEDKTSYLVKVIKDKISLKEAYVVEQFHVALVKNFQSTGIRVIDMVERMKVHLAI